MPKWSDLALALALILSPALLWRSVEWARWGEAPVYWAGLGFLLRQDVLSGVLLPPSIALSLVAFLVHLPASRRIVRGDDRAELVVKLSDGIMIQQVSSEPFALAARGSRQQESPSASFDSAFLFASAPSRRARALGAAAPLVAWSTLFFVMWSWIGAFPDSVKSGIIAWKDPVLFAVAAALFCVPWRAYGTLLVSTGGVECDAPLCRVRWDEILDASSNGRQLTIHRKGGATTSIWLLPLGVGRSTADIVGEIIRARLAKETKIGAHL